MNFTFLENDQQALAKVASGVQYRPDPPVHRVLARLQGRRLIQRSTRRCCPTTRASRGDPARVASGRTADLPRAVATSGLDRVTYRRDKVNPPSCRERAAGCEVQGPHGVFSDEVSIIKIGHLHQRRQAVVTRTS
jgi:hypothetical protein